MLNGLGECREDIEVEIWNGNQEDSCEEER